MASALVYLQRVVLDMVAKKLRKMCPPYCYQDVAAVADAASATSPNQEETTNMTSRPLILICPLALLLAEAAIAQHQSDSHPVIINAIYGSWDERWALAASDNDSHTLTISDGYNLCGSATSFTAVGPGYIAGSTGAVDNCIGSGAASAAACSQLVWSDCYEYTPFAQHTGEAVGVAQAYGELHTEAHGKLQAATATIILRANWEAEILQVSKESPSVSAGSTNVGEQTILGVSVPGFGTSGGFPKAAKQTPITIPPRDTNIANRDLTATANVYALANGFFTLARCYGRITGEANTTLILTDRHL